MTSTPHLPIDPYDDSFALLGGETSETHKQLVKTAQDLSRRRDNLGDSEFALVLATHDDDGNTTLHRKYACVDPGNTAVNVLYFLARHASLPPVAVKVAAQNLLFAAKSFGLNPPETLVKLAGEEDPQPATNVVHVPLEQVCEPTVKVAADSTKTTKSDVRQALDFFRANDHMLTGWAKRALAQKIAGEMNSRGFRLPANVEKYAADTYAPDIEYAILHRISRCRVENDDHTVNFTKSAALRGAYQDLLDNRGRIAPKRFAAILETIDKTAGFYGDSTVPDAVFTTFGKQAQEETEKVLFSHVGRTVTRKDLEELVLAHRERVAAQFGEGVAESMQKQPTEIFKSMPAPQKEIFAKMVSQMRDPS